MRRQIKHAGWMLLAAAALMVPAHAIAGDNSNNSGPYADNFKLGDRAQSYAEQSARYHDARQRFDDASADLLQARQAAVADFQSSPEYVSAARAVGETYRTFISKKREVIRQIEQRDPRYVELRRQAADIDAELQTARANPNTTISQFQDLYNKKSVFTREMNALEEDALDKANSAELQHRWEAASRALTELRAKQDSIVEQSAGVKAALAEVAKAKDELEEIGAKLAGSKAAYVQAQSQQAAADDYLSKYPTYTNAYDGWGLGWGFTPLYGGYGGGTFYGGYGYPVVGQQTQSKLPTWPWYH